MYPAIEFVESSNRPNAIGDEGRAVGILQIHPIVVRDVNKYLGRDYYTLNDRYDPDKSRMILLHYCRMYAHLRPASMSREEFVARLWHRGPTQFLDAEGTAYWRKVHAVKIQQDRQAQAARARQNARQSAPSH